MQKLPSSIKNGLRALFLITITIYGSNIVKNGLVLLSECWLEVEVLNNKLKSSKNGQMRCISSCVTQLFFACPNSFETSCEPAFCRYLRFARPHSSSAVNPKRVDSCNWKVPNMFETNLSIHKKTGRSSC